MRMYGGKTWTSGAISESIHPLSGKIVYAKFDGIDTGPGFYHSAFFYWFVANKADYLAKIGTRRIDEYLSIHTYYSNTCNRTFRIDHYPS